MLCQTLQGQLNTLKAAMQVLGQQFDSLRARMPGLEQTYRDTWRHAQDLEGMATRLREYVT